VSVSLGEGDLGNSHRGLGLVVAAAGDALDLLDEVELLAQHVDLIHTSVAERLAVSSGPGARSH
jgi:hypothetical protein